MNKEISFLLWLLLASCYASLSGGYELVHGIPYNRTAKADTKNVFCPAPDNNNGCDCTQGPTDPLPSYICQRANLDSIIAYFQRPFPTYLALNITIFGASLGSIPANIFSDKQPKKISIIDAGITYIDPNAFAIASYTLEILEINYNPYLQAFPFSSSDFVALKTLNLNNNDIRSLAGIKGLAKLQKLDVNFNSITELPIFPYLPSLKRLSVQGSGITRIPREKPFYLLQDLETLILADNPLVNIETNTFEFLGSLVQTIDLSGCSISNIQPQAFSGITSDTQILLKSNLLTTLPSEVFEPVLNTMSAGSGYVDVTGNPITCCCEVNWLISNPILREKVQGAVCPGGSPVNELPVDALAPFCSPLP